MGQSGRKGVIMQIGRVQRQIPVTKCRLRSGRAILPLSWFFANGMFENIFKRGACCGGVFEILDSVPGPLKIPKIVSRRRPLKNSYVCNLQIFSNLYCPIKVRLILHYYNYFLK